MFALVHLLPASVQARRLLAAEPGRLRLNAADAPRRRLTWLPVRLLLCALASAAALANTGCISCAYRAVPANRLPGELLPASRSARVPIDFTLLRQQAPEAHIVGPRDVLGVYIQDVVPSTANRQEPNILNLPVTTKADYYPPRGLVNSPAVGLPVEVTPEGNLVLPLVNPIAVQGLTLSQATERLRSAYIGGKILEKGRERIMLTLIKPRVNRVLVLRDDVDSGNPTLQPLNSPQLTRRGTAHVIDLPAFENDVLHALAVTGGLPGIDAYSTVWICRSRTSETGEFVALKQQIDLGQDPREIVRNVKTERSAVPIPLRVLPGEPLPFQPDDVILKTGDVLYVESRQKEFFFSGGVMPAGQVPLPRDYDLDVMGAIALVNGNVAGPAGGVTGIGSNFKGSSLGAIVPPTRVLILRKLPDGEQIQIRVDLKRAMRDPRERVIIQPNDVVMLLYKPGEVLGNAALNIVNLNVTILPSAFSGSTSK